MENSRFLCALVALLVWIVPGANAQTSSVGKISDVRPTNVAVADRGNIIRPAALRRDVVKNVALFEDDLLQLFNGVLADLDLGEVRIVAGDAQQIGEGRYQIREGRAESIGGIVFAILHGTAALESVARNVRCWVDVVRRGNEVLMDQVCENGDRASLFRIGSSPDTYGATLATAGNGFVPPGTSGSRGRVAGAGGYALAFDGRPGSGTGSFPEERVQMMISVDSTTGVVECYLNSGAVRFPEYKDDVIAEPGSFWVWPRGSDPERVLLSLAEKQLWQMRTDFQVRDVWKPARRPLLKQRWFQGALLGTVAVTAAVLVLPSSSSQETTSGRIVVTLPN